MSVQFLHEIVEPNGKTVKQNNLGIPHKIPVGALVEVKYSNWFRGGAGEIVHARLWVVRHSRDCDGTPLYSLSRYNDPGFSQQVCAAIGGFGEESLTPVEITQAVLDGSDEFGRLLDNYDGG